MRYEQGVNAKNHHAITQKHLTSDTHHWTSGNRYFNGRCFRCRLPALPGFGNFIVLLQFV